MKYKVEITHLSVDDFYNITGKKMSNIEDYNKCLSAIKQYIESNINIDMVKDKLKIRKIYKEL